VVSLFSGRQILVFGRRLSPVEVFARIDEITLQGICLSFFPLLNFFLLFSDVMEVATRHLSDIEPTVVTVGPSHGFPDYLMVRERTYWRRT
jgi:hypothetical protein